MFGKKFRCCSSLALLATLLAGSSALAQEGLPDGAAYRGEIRRGVDGQLTIQQAPKPVIQSPAEAGESMTAGNDATPRTAMPVKRVDPGPTDLSCLAGGTKLSATERTLVLMPADSWLSLPGTAFGKFCRLHESKPLRAVGGCDMVIEAWSGGVYDERRQLLLVIGGGGRSSNYWGNEVYGFSPATGWWTIVKPASPLGPSGKPSEPMPDGIPCRGIPTMAWPT